MEKAVMVFSAERVPVTSERKESLADRVLPFAAMLGAVGGAIGGAILGQAVGTAFPVVFGTLGTMLGSGLVGGGWCLLARSPHFTKSEVPHEHSEPVAAPSITPAPSAG
jgi:hypothetical protein